MSRWSTLDVDEASVAQLGALAPRQVVEHAELIAARRLKPVELYGRWERQQWSADDISFGQDRHDFDHRLPRRFREQLRGAIATFIVGEYTGLDMLAPVMLGARAEDDLVFLGTQVADEARHARLMFRLGHEVLGFDEDPSVMLRQAWDLAEPEHRALAAIEGELMRATVSDPSDYENWVRSVTLFHLVTEGILAVSGQRALVRQLSRLPLLPGIRSGFAAMCRDESRHISFGLHSLRIALQEGHAGAVEDVLERTVPLALAMTRSMEPRNGAVGAAAGADDVVTTGVDSFRRAMRWIGADPAFTRHIVDRSLAAPGADLLVATRSGAPAPVSPIDAPTDRSTP